MYLKKEIFYVKLLIYRNFIKYYSFTWNKKGGLDTKITPAKSAHITITRNIPQGSFKKMKDNAITITGELNIIVVASPIGNLRKL